MTRSKLSEAEKREITQLFLQDQETIAGLAERFQVSVSTIRRLVKTATPEIESGLAPVSGDEAFPTESRDAAIPVPVDPVPSQPQRDRPRKRIEMPVQKSDAARISQTIVQPESSYDAGNSAVPLGDLLAEIGQDLQRDLSTRKTLEAEVEEEEEEDDLQGFEDDFDDNDDDLEDLDESAEDVGDVLQLSSANWVEVLPIAEALLPRICYVVVDRMAELVTCPLKDFGDLGQIPASEVQANTLPVFDNHRIARRFSHRAQRIVKVPNGNMFKKASIHLMAKGITRLLVNGRIYAL
jgi:transposase-like protein